MKDGYNPLLIALGLLYAHGALAQTVEALNLLCKRTACRPEGTTVRLLLDDGKPFETKFKHPVPIVQDAFLNIFSGETLNIEAELKGNSLVPLRAVTSITRPSQTLILRMWQEPGNSNTYFQITNPFPVTLKYSAGTMLPDREDLQRTSSCPVMGDGRSAYESWPYAIFQLVLANFQVLPPGVETKCD